MLIYSYAWWFVRQPGRYDRALIDDWMPFPGRRVSVILPYMFPGRVQLITYTHNCTVCGGPLDGHPSACSFSNSIARDFAPVHSVRGFSPLGFEWVADRQRPHRYDLFMQSLWPPLVLFSLYPAVTFLRGPLRRRWRKKRGLCTTCGYVLRGNTTGRCPECGTKHSMPLPHGA